MNSTSVHRLNADKKLSRTARRLWFVLNHVNNNLFPNAKAPGLILRDFVPDISPENWIQLGVKSSPSRKLSDLFWQQLPWGLIQSELGAVNVHDTGCGSGDYGVKLNAYFAGGLASYTGVDVSPRVNWNSLTQSNPRFRFQELDSGRISSAIPTDANLFISQSAVEHFESDLLYFKQIRDFVRRTSRSIIQIHMVPSSACLRLYSYHGVRQYTPRTISYVTRLFEDYSYSTLYRLGGRHCNQLHWDFITTPIQQARGDQRETRTEEYDMRLRLAIAADKGDSGREPSFYALVTHSNWKAKIFGQPPIL